MLYPHVLMMVPQRVLTARSRQRRNVRFLGHPIRRLTHVDVKARRIRHRARSVLLVTFKGTILNLPTLCIRGVNRRGISVDHFRLYVSRVPGIREVLFQELRRGVYQSMAIPVSLSFPFFRSFARNDVYLKCVRVMGDRSLFIMLRVRLVFLVFRPKHFSDRIRRAIIRFRPLTRILYSAMGAIMVMSNGFGPMQAILRVRQIARAALASATNTPFHSASNSSPPCSLVLRRVERENLLYLIHGLCVRQDSCYVCAHLRAFSFLRSKRR